MSKLTILVEAVNPKFANKYNSGSVLSNGNWYSVKRPVNLDDFKKGELVDVEVTTQESKGKVYENITKVLGSAEPNTICENDSSRTVSTAKAQINTFQFQARDYTAEGRGKTLCALSEAALSSPYLAMASSEEEFIEKADRLVDHFFKKVFPNG